MSLRLVSIIAVSSFICLGQAYSQNCQDCKTRKVILYDNEVTVPRPSSNVDSIYRYWDYFFITGGVKSYLSSQDPTRDCIRRMDGAFFTEKDSVTSNIKFGAEHANLPPDGEVGNGFPTYLLYGVVSSSQVTLKLEAGKSRELVKSRNIPLSTGFEPIDVGITLAASIGPMYTTIMDFERRKRDEGEPYAIQPTLTLIPAKTKLKVNEKTYIDVVFKDCDGAPLKQRHIIFTAEGGTLKSVDVTTDDQGRGTLEFTAGPIPALAEVNTEYRYQNPTGDMSNAAVVPASIQIDKPNTSWYVQAAFQVENTSDLTRKSEYETVSSSSMDNMKIRFYAWATNMNPLAGQFSVIPQTVSDILYMGNSTESSFWHSHNEISAGGVTAMIDDQLNSSTSAKWTTAQTPELVLSIYKNSYSFSISKMDAIQTGGEYRVRKSVDPFGSRNETTFTPAEATRKLGLSVGNVNRDTTYTTGDTTTQSGGSTTTVTQVTQTFSWKNNVCTLNYLRHVNEDSHVTGIYTENASSTQTFNVTLYLTYTGDAPTGVEAKKQIVPTAFALSQNYPNPFNPTTTISYILPSATRTSLVITDLLGRKVATLVDGEKSAGVHIMTWNATGLPSGVYFLQMRAGEFVETRKLLLAK
jgi:hypothetical protein